MRTYTGRLDGCLDFAFCRSVRQLCAGATPAISLAHSPTPSAQPPLLRPTGPIHPARVHRQPRHEPLPGRGGRRRGAPQTGAALLFALGDTPILYYGTEVGLSQPRLKGPYREESRHPMRWGDAQDRELLAWFKRSGLRCVPPTPRSVTARCAPCTWTRRPASGSSPGSASTTKSASGSICAPARSRTWAERASSLLAPFHPIARVCDTLLAC
ncbi:MAG: hypothetical protein R3A10_16265 [Caldilineaceae bacterium]